MHVEPHLPHENEDENLHQLFIFFFFFNLTIHTVLRQHFVAITVYLILTL